MEKEWKYSGKRMERGVDIVNNSSDYYYECIISDDVIWIMYYRENQFIQDCPTMKRGKFDQNVNDMLDSLTPNQRKIISTICDMTKIKGASIPVSNVIEVVYKFGEEPEESSFGKNIRIIGKKFSDVGQELLFKFSSNMITGGVIVSKIEKVKKENDVSDSDGNDNPDIRREDINNTQKKYKNNMISNFEDNSDFIQNHDKTKGLNDEKDTYYLNEIKARAIALYGDNRMRTISILHNYLFLRRKELSESAKSEIDCFFATEFVDELIRQGLNEELAQWYSDLWNLWCMRQIYKEKFEKAKAEQDYERMEMSRRHSNRYEDMIDALIEQITIYNNSLDNGGRI